MPSFTVSRCHLVIRHCVSLFALTELRTVVFVWISAMLSCRYNLTIQPTYNISEKSLNKKAYRSGRSQGFSVFE